MIGGWFIINTIFFHCYLHGWKSHNHGCDNLRFLTNKSLASWESSKSHRQLAIGQVLTGFPAIRWVTFPANHLSFLGRFSPGDSLFGWFQPHLSVSQARPTFFWLGFGSLFDFGKKMRIAPARYKKIQADRTLMALISRSIPAEAAVKTSTVWRPGWSTVSTTGIWANLGWAVDWWAKTVISCRV